MIRENFNWIVLIVSSFMFAINAIKLEKEKQRKDLFNEIYCGIWMICFLIILVSAYI